MALHLNKFDSPWRNVGKARDLSFEQTWMSFTHSSFVIILVEIGPWGKKKMKMWKAYNNNERTADKFLLEPSAQVS